MCKYIYIYIYMYIPLALSLGSLVHPSSAGLPPEAMEPGGPLQGLSCS